MKLSQIAALLGCACTDADRDISRISSLDSADERCISFLSDPRLKEKAAQCKAAAMIVSKGNAVPGKVNLEVGDPYLGYAKVAQLFENEMIGRPVPHIDSSAVIDAHAHVDPAATVGALAVIGPDAAIGPGTTIGAHCVIERGTIIGAECRIDSGVVIRYDTRIGDRVIIQSGSVIGSDGFANAMDKGTFVRIPCFGNVVIEDDVQIGACCTIDRGNFEPTVIKKGARLDNLIQIAHNVIIGEHTAMAAQAGVSGSTRIGNHVMVGGQAGFVGHIEIGDQAFIGAKSGVSKSIAPGEKVTGYPARGFMKMRRIEAAQAELPRLIKDVKDLKKKIERT